MCRFNYEEDGGTNTVDGWGGIERNVVMDGRREKIYKLFGCIKR